jgi:hypothetical protein
MRTGGEAVSAVATSAMTRHLRRSRLIVALVLTLVAGWRASAQPQAVLTGSVVDAETGVAIRGAAIAAMKQSIARTGPEGTFTAPMPAGTTLFLTVSKPGYVTEQLTARTLATGRLDVRMRRGAVLVAYVIDEQGRPVARANVMVLCPGAPSGSRATDDLGEARVAGLPPGRCTVRTSQAQVHMTISIGGPVSAADLQRASEALREQLAERARQRAEQARQQMQLPGVEVELRAGEETVIALGEMSGEPPVSIVALPLPGALVPTGTATVQGRVAEANGLPAAGVLVQMIGPAGQRAVLTNEAGQYLFTALPAGRFQIGVSPVVQLTGLIPAARAGLIDLREGQAATADLRVTRASILTGTVVDEFGDPAQEVTVRVTGLRALPGAPTTIPASAGASARTDDRGRYRVVLPPGTYRVAAVIGAFGQREEPVYFPGTIRMADAGEVDVLPEVETAGIDIATARRTGVTLRGTVVNAAGQPVEHGMAMLIARPLPAPADRPPQVPVVNGTFEFPSLREGQYDVLVTAPPPPFLILTHRNGQLVDPTIPPVTEYAWGAVEVQAVPVGLTLRTGPPSVLHGRVDIEGVGAGLSPAALRFVPINVALPVPQLFGVANDWTFRITDLTSTTRIGLVGAPPGWWLKAFMVNGVNAATTPVDFSGGRQTDGRVQAVLARMSRLAGRVTNAAGARGTVVAFPAAADLRYQRSPFVRAAAIDADGNYDLSLPPGHYFVAAVPSLGLPGAVPPSLPAPAAMMPGGGINLTLGEATMSRLESVSTSVLVDETGEQRQDLALVAAP